MEKLKQEIKQLTDFQKVELIKFLRDDLKLKTTTEIARKYSKSYGGVNSSAFGAEILKVEIGKTIYYVDRD